MKNSVKFFFGGIIATALIFGAFAFTAKQNTNKEYLIVRIIEDAESDLIFVQVSGKDGMVEAGEEKLAETEGGLYKNKKADHVSAIANVVNKYAAQGYIVKSSSSKIKLSTSGYGGGSNEYIQYTNMVLEK